MTAGIPIATKFCSRGSASPTKLPMTIGAMNDWTALEGMALPEILAAAGPALAVSILVQAVMSSLQLAVLYAPFSAAYRDIKAG